ncbi:MAG: hypothetical protein IJA91_03765 [Clostridia bacterium]|nr:hypothetical protein [Clostridia bacterium]
MENQNRNQNRHERRRTTRRTVICALLCALAVVFLGLGALIEVFDLTAAAVAALVLLPILLCYGGRYAWLSYAVTAVLGVMLMPQSLASWTFAGLTGYYPIIKNRLDRLPRVVGWVVKVFLLTAVLVLYLAVFHFVVMGGEGSFTDSFFKGFGEAGGSAYIAWAVIGLSLFTFILFDILIDRVLILYYLRWQKRFEKWMGK